MLGPARARDVFARRRCRVERGRACHWLCALRDKRLRARRGQDTVRLVMELLLWKEREREKGEREPQPRLSC